MQDTNDAPLYARVGRQLEGPLHGALVPLQQEIATAPLAQHDPRQLRRVTLGMAALAIASVVALGAQLVCAATRAAPSTQVQGRQDVGAGLATAAHAGSRVSSSPAADAPGR